MNFTIISGYHYEPHVWIVARHGFQGPLWGLTVGYVMGMMPFLLLAGYGSATVIRWVWRRR